MKHLLLYSLYLLSGAALAGASLYPETWVSLLLALAFSVGVAVALAQPGTIYRGLFLAGLSFHFLAFYWIPETIELFGGFSITGSILVFILFSVTASLQFLLFGLLWKIIASNTFRTFGLALPVAWMFVEHIFPRLFPWQLGHALIIFTPLASLAEFVGVTPLSGLLLWWAAVLTRFVGRLRWSASDLAVTAVVSVLLGLLGHAQTGHITTLLRKSPEVTIAMIQGNLGTDRKNVASFFSANIERYRALSDEAVAAGAQLVFWPESVVNQWLPEAIRNVRGGEYDPAPELTVPLVYGTLSYADRSPEEIAELRRRYPQQERLVREMSYRKYNAAVGIHPDGSIAGRYYKRILMPFGEYLPFEDMFPTLREISPQTGDFTEGSIKEPIEIRLPNTAVDEVRLGILICYEDLVPALSAEQVRAGATVLVNLTNDAWYGDTAAPHQHHLLAQWRAIEARRYLLRVTNTGKTALVNPLGQTTAMLPVFVEDTLLANISPLDEVTFYARWEDRPLRVFLLSYIVIAVILGRKSKRSDTTKN